MLLAAAGIVGFSLGGLRGAAASGAVDEAVPRIARAAIGYNMLVDSASARCSAPCIRCRRRGDSYLAAWSVTAALALAGAMLFRVSARAGR
jgi:hypothetical protein